MRLDHLLSKDRFCGGGFLVVCCCLGRGWSGPAGAASVEGSWLLLLLLACVVGVGVGGCRVSGVGDTPACFCFLLVWGWGLVGALACVVFACVGVACCRGSGVVRPGCLACFSASLCCGWWGWVWVGWL